VSDEASAIQEAKKKASLKAKKTATSRPEAKEGGLLGGADYVNLMMGGRGKAKAEAAKLPMDLD